MLQVQVFNSNDEEFLTNKVNDWLRENDNYKIRDIKFSNSCSTSDYGASYTYCAMVIYEV